MTTDPATSADPQAGDTDPQPQAGVTSTDPQAGESQTNDTISLDEAKKLRSEAANLRSRLRSTEAKAKELDDLKAKLEADKLSETEKLQKQLADLQSQHDNAIKAAQERTINYEVRLQAAQMGIVDPDAASKLLDWSHIEYDDNGAPTNVDDLLKALVKAKPYLAGGKVAVPTSGGATNPSRSSSTVPQALSWEIIGRMKPDEYTARRTEIQKWIEQHPHRFGGQM